MQIQIPDHLSKEQQKLLRKITDLLVGVPGIKALVLGGSCAAGTNTEKSDLDIGLYYSEKEPFAIDVIKNVASEIAIGNNFIVTDFYEWGPWVNGGAWINTTSGKVDFLYRNIGQVERTIADSLNGELFHDYGQQPVYGFFGVIYLAEIRICLPLHDPESVIKGLKDKVRDYPAALKTRIVGDYLWSAEFTLNHAAGFAASGDVCNTAGCLARITGYVTQVLFALNETYFIGDKRLADHLSRFSVIPPGFLKELTAIMSAPGSRSEELRESVDRMKRLWQGVVDMTEGTYKPKF